MKNGLIVSLSFFAVFSIAPALASAQELLPDPVEGTGNYFLITDSEYLNVYVQSTEEITVSLESIPKTISLLIDSSTSTDLTTLTIGGLKPSTSYYKYTDSYRNGEIIATDTYGKYVFSQNIVSPHHVWLQETKGTVFLPEDCPAYGNWDGASQTCILTQNLTQSIEITDNNITLDCDNHSVTSTDSGFGIYLYNNSGATIKNCQVSHFSYGIYPVLSSGNTIFNNNFRENTTGISLNSSYGNIISENSASFNLYDGLNLQNSNGNSVTNNTISNNRRIGLLLSDSPNSYLRNNSLTNNKYNFGSWGPFLGNIQDIDISNTVNGKPIYYLVNEQDKTIDASSNAGYVGAVNSRNITVKDVNISNNVQGIFFDNTTGSKVENSHISDNMYGLEINRSSNNQIVENDIWDNELGIRLWISSHTTITDNNFSASSFYITGSSDAWSHDSRIYHNNFKNNPQPRVDRSYNDLFDNDYPEGGNYWSDYTGQDQYSGPNQDQPGNDGIGDTPYTFPWRQDRYPWMKENGWKKKEVPLYTQIESPYPSIEETRFWSERPYAHATQRNPYLSCGWLIRECGCAITSMVMLGRYYDIDAAIDDSGVDPGNINSWLTNNEGYTSDGRLWWSKAIEYSGFIDETTGQKMARLNLDFYNASTSISWQMDKIDNYITSSKPAIAYSAKFGHYFVIDNKLAATYAIKDPRWYNTITLDDPEDLTNNIRDYDNHFDVANLFSYLETPKPITASIFLYLASPAELIVTDPLERKLGRNPTADINYNEIPDSSYTKEGPIVTSDIPLDLEQIHESKVIYIPSPISGEYNIQVIGTATGSYTVDLLVYDQTGQSKYTVVEGNTAINNIQEFNLSYSTETIGETEFYRIVNIDIKPGSYPNSINLKSKGVIPVAILTDKFFNAKDVVISSIIFAGAKPMKGKLEDIDKDGDLDLILHFDTRSIRLSPTSTEAILTAQLTSGTLIKGTDSVRIIQVAVQPTIFSRLFSYLNQFIQNLLSAIGLAAIR